MTHRKTISWNLWKASHYSDYSDYSDLISALNPENKQSALMTVEKYLEIGSVSMTGEALLCNRNTMTKRIKQFEDATHLDLRNPRDLALSVLLIPHIQSSSKQPTKS